MKTLTPCIIAALLAGCSLLTTPKGSQLTRTWDGKQYAPINRYEWVVADPKTVASKCAPAEEDDDGNTLGCTIRLYHSPGGPKCIIFSVHTEEQAKRVWNHNIFGVRTITHWSHEVEQHCFAGKNHRVQE